MQLETLASAVPGATIAYPVDSSSEITDIAYDSRRVERGSLFIAVPGEKFDGHGFIPAALHSGASAVAIDANRADKFATLSVPRLLLPDVRTALAPLSCRFYDDPTHALHLAGVTGTNGKTTTVRMIEAIARTTGDKTGTIGTLGATIADTQLPGERTTPEAPDLQRLFARMRSEGVRSVAIEVASHALALGRTDGCAFDVAIFTNLTQDHLDFHGSMERYRDAKARLFTDYADTAKAAGKSLTVVLNDDDATGSYYAKIQRGSRCLRYSASGNIRADIVAREIHLAVDRINFTAQTPIGDIRVELGFGGAFNIANALAAIGYGIARGLSAGTIAQGLATCQPAPGRFQPVRAGQPFAVLVDYAHTPDGLENVLRSVRELPHKRLITVFGCGGDRDRTKRPVMGRIAVELSDVAIVTSDNPRTEDPESILDAIMTGMDTLENKIVLREVDRRKAIGLAVRTALPGDTVVIAGKGHENYQIVGTTTLPFDDMQVAAEEITECSAH